MNGVARAFGYFRVPVTDALSGKSPYSDASARLEEYARTHVGGAEWGGAFGDDSSARGETFGCRPGGLAVQQELSRGDFLVVEHVGRAFAGWADFLKQLRLWETVGNHVFFVEPACDTVTESGRAALALLREFAKLDAGRKAEAASAGNRRRRAAGKAINQHPPFGWKLAGPKGRRRVMKDDHARDVARHVVQWRLAGYSFTQIYFHLRQHRIKTADGREWSRSALQRAYAGMCRLLADEANAE